MDEREEVEVAVEVNDIVKIVDDGESFWIIVTDIGRKYMTGIVDNVLVMPHDYQCGDEIKFPIDMIVDVRKNQD